MMNLICISCPLGCHMEVTMEGAQLIIRGNQCKRGAVYAETELKNPTRLLTTTVRIKGAMYKRLPVKSEREIPKGLIFEAMAMIATLEVQGPVRIHDVICEDLVGTGIGLIATRSMKSNKQEIYKVMP